jgi:hypothetical protein
LAAGGIRLASSSNSKLLLAQPSPPISGTSFEPMSSAGARSIATHFGGFEGCEGTYIGNLDDPELAGVTVEEGVEAEDILTQSAKTRNEPSAAQPCE